ncbi:hypothetical protein SAMN04488595_11858 [Ralstonia sp. 25mfcol4.1]|uniref:hypothetical protein n=1 Tax=Ralstonia sp. 25mfcol4.1 TaxID=1761899 RepID=UPI00048E87D1|nr:hypothetical protein [Ralstonia sp. 25mfcol4.1]SDP72494.1 hypothetical protein SAMN04488595_11858 [Ralstonia sp. 25mfcol4.1]
MSFIFAYVFAGAFAVLGLGSALILIFQGKLADSFFWLFFGGIGATILVNVRHQHRRMVRMKTENHAWYRRTYPNAVRGDAITCHACAGRHIRVRGLMQRTFMREHFCSQCGTALYFSPEPR